MRAELWINTRVLFMRGCEKKEKRRCARVTQINTQFDTDKWCYNEGFVFAPGGDTARQPPGVIIINFISLPLAAEWKRVAEGCERAFERESSAAWAHYKL